MVFLLLERTNSATEAGYWKAMGKVKATEAGY